MSLILVEAGIADLQSALENGSISSVELVARYLLRIFTYDCRGPCLNSIPILNPKIFEEAAASDIRRRSGQVRGRLDGIPYTLKDSMKYKGMTCATGSPAFKDLVANEDSFVAEQLRNAGAVCVGRTNTPPMMDSGMHRGLYGRSESPYNLEYLTAAFSSGSSNGAATSTAASFAAFGLGSETVSSGRSPASNNGLIVYTPSRGVISPRGTWPLYPTCDVLSPLARTVKDMLAILEVLTKEDQRTDGDFWREQKFVEIPKIQRPSSYPDVISQAEGCLRGKRIAVPKMYIGGHDPKAKPTVVSEDVIKLWQQARVDLEALGASVTETDFPLVTKYEFDSVSGKSNVVQGFKPDWNDKERGELVALIWDDFLKANHDPSHPGLGSVDGEQIFPIPEGHIPDRYREHSNWMTFSGLVDLARDRKDKSIWDIDGMAEALPALEAQRKRDFEDWMDEIGIDLVVFPSIGDVGKADIETNDESARHALQSGVKYSNGHRAIRHMGVPTTSVSMGMMSMSKMPMNLTFAGKCGQDTELLRYAYAFEERTKHRFKPPVTPALDTDALPDSRVDNQQQSHKTSSLGLVVGSAKKTGPSKVQVTGRIQSPSTEKVQLDAFIDGKSVPDSSIKLSDVSWSFESDFTPFKPAKPLYGGYGLPVGTVNIIVLARSLGLVAGKLVMIDQDAPVETQRSAEG